MTTQLSSGTSKPPPQYLVAPPLLEFGDGALVRNLYCYVLRHYGTDGIGVLYYRQGSDICVQLGDWQGNTLDMNRADDPLVQLAGLYLHQYNLPVYNLLHAIGLPQAQLFLNRQLMLVELQSAVNKLAGPGMLQNIFSNTIQTPEVLSIDVIDQRVIDVILAGTGSYTGDLIIKPSRFRHYQLPNRKYVPLQVQMVR